jgi:peptide/nickel transport system substrate-binding protein
MLSKKNLFVVFAALIIASMVLSACAQPQPEPETIIQTVVVTEVVEKEGETVVETKIVEVEVEVTPVPEPEETEPPMAAISPEFKDPDTVVIVGGAGEQETLDPAWTYETRGGAIELNVYEGLVFFNKDKTDEFVPQLATEWEVNETGDVFTFQLREGVTFHKGGTLEPHDVAYSVHRALLQDRIDGPHWMTLEAFFGLYSIEDLAMEIAGVESFEEVPDAALVETCEMVKAAVVADDEAGTVTYNLNAPTPWFLTMMVQNWFFVLDQEWMVENGDWDGDCENWVAFHDPAAQDTILFDQANGTGPYMLDHWTPGEETVLVANENYWRTEPAWEGGPSGPASIKRVVLKNISEWGTRLAMFEAGDADWIYVPLQYRPQLEPYIRNACNTSGECEEVNPDGYIRAFVNLPNPAMTPAQFNWDINVEGGNPYVGSGAIDGNGIPPDLFQDKHVRNAFNWCFDWDALIDDVLVGEAVQPRGPIITGMMGSLEDQEPLFHYDPDKCAEEFQAAFDGQLWDLGFYMQIAYNEGNDNRRGLAEIMKAGIEAVNPAFNVQVIAMPWPVLLNSRRQAKLPIYIGGWLEDYHDPHNWVHPFLHSQGNYGRVVNIQSGDPETAAMFDALIDEAASLTTVEERRPIYEEIQLKSQEEAVMLWGYQEIAKEHYQNWITEYYYNPGLSNAEYAVLYAMKKEAP